MKDGDPVTPGSRSLGTGANQAAPGNSASLFMPGDLKISAAANPTTGWLLCDGSTVDRVAYAALFAAISTAYGAGDGSTTFGLPDYRGRTIVGAGTGAGLSPRAIGGKGGEENHPLAIGEVPAHAHSITDVSHRHGPDGGGDAFLTHFAASGWAYVVSYGTGANIVAAINNYPVTAYSGSGITGTNNAGGGGSHNNMQPFAVANVFIKT
jgi:microcystin-dependent protein